MKVIATQDGFHGGSLIKKGKIFDFDGEKLGSWMKPVDKKTGKEAKQKQEEVNTFSEMTKKNQEEEQSLIEQKTGKEA